MSQGFVLSCIWENWLKSWWLREGRWCRLNAQRRQETWILWVWKYSKNVYVCKFERMCSFHYCRRSQKTFKQSNILNKPFTFQSSSYCSKFIEIQSQSWSVTNEKHQNISHKYGWQMVFFLQPFLLNLLTIVFLIFVDI